MTLQKKRIIGIIATIALLLLIPLIAMQFTNEVNWSLSDFAIMAGLLFGAAMAYELIASRSEKTLYKTAFGIGLAGAFLLIWVNGAVGIIGNEGQDANLLYGAVLLVGLIGSITSRFRPLGMSHTLFAAATVQMLVPVVAILIWPPSTTSWSPSILGVFILSGFFAMLFVISALLFRQASAPPTINHG